MDWKNRVKKMRQRAGMTQQKFATALGFAMTTIYKWEAGEMVPGWMSQEKLVAFEVELDREEREMEEVR